MKKLIYLILIAVFLTGSCSKEVNNDAALADETSNALKCKTNAENDQNSKVNWRQINEMIRNIHWIEQACFRIEGPRRTLYIDPLSITKTDVADIILVSHNHGDHFSPADIDKLVGPNTVLIAPVDCNYTGTVRRVVLKPGEEYKAKGLKIKAVPAYNITKTNFHPKSNNWVGYLITMNGVTIYHAGDTERIPEMKDINCDIAMLPLGQTYTMNTVADAAESAKDVKAQVAIPMHFGLYEGTEADAQTFKSLLDGIIKVVIKTKEQ